MKKEEKAKDPVCGMSVEKSTGLKLGHGGKTYYFCSQHCLEKFAAENNADMEKCPACMAPPPKAWYKNKVFIAGLALIIPCFLSMYIPVFVPFRVSLVMYVKMLWWAVILGLALGGVIEYYIPREYISKVLSKPKKRTILYSVIFGFLMSACSHGILAIAIQLHKKGASNAAVVSFLLASPWANLPLTILLVGFFGIKGFFIIFSAIIIALITGLIYQFLDNRGLIETNKNTADVAEDFSIRRDIKRRVALFRFTRKTLAESTRGIFDGSVALGNMVLWWMFIGFGIAAVIGGYVPSSIFQKGFNPGISGLLLTLGAATVIEVCSEGSAPIAFELFRQTGALGNSLVFLMAGVVTDYTEIGLLWANVGKKVAVWLPIITVPQVLLLGMLANVLF